MNRITDRAVRATRYACMALALAGLAAFAMAQAPGPQIPDEAKQAVLEFGGNGQVTLNGKPAHLSPASQIRGTNNLIVLPQSLQGKYTTRVLLGQDGSIHRAWIIKDNK